MAAKPAFGNNPDVVFIAPTFDEDTKVKAFLQKHSFKYYIVANQAALVQQYGVQVFPFSLVIDKGGHITFFRAMRIQVMFPRNCVLL